MKKSSLIPVLLFAIGSCTPKDSGPVIVHESARDNHMNATGMVVSIEDNLPDMHSFTMLILAGDTLIVHDNRGDLQFTAYDIYADTTIGQFGKFGNGPGEIANFGATFYDPNSKFLYGRNSNQNKIVNFYLPEAVADPGYDAIDKFKLDFFQYPFTCPNYINDTTIICTIFIPKGTAQLQLGNLNLITGKAITLDSVTYYDRARFGINVSPEKNMIFAADRKQDVISIYTLDGKLQRRIFGPDYGMNASSRDAFFSTSAICNKKVAIIYSGPESNAPGRIIFDKIIITDLNGNYIRTLDFDFSINDIVYHAKTNRLYMTTDGEPQFCYLPLDKL